MREGGAILGYHAEISPQAIGIGLQAMVSVRMTRHSRVLLERFHEHLLALPEVLSFTTWVAPMTSSCTSASVTAITCAISR